MPPKLPLILRPTTKVLREQLHQFEAAAQALQLERDSLEDRLRGVQERINFNDDKIRGIMNELDDRLFKEHRSQSQPDFQRRVIGDDFVIDGICTKMHGNPKLKSAIEAISQNHGTIADNNLLLMAILTELSGEPYYFAHNVALRIVEYNQTKEQQRQKVPVLPSFTSASPAPVNPYLPAVEATAAQSPSIRVARDASVVSLLSPSIKSESSSSAHPYNGASALPTRAASALASTPGLFSSPVATTAIPPADRGSVIAHGMSTLQKSFPGFLETLKKPSTTRIPKAPPAAADAGATAGAKRGRDDETTPSPGAVKQGKKARLEKEPAIAHTFVMFMKHLEQLHQTSQDISEILKCSRCHAAKRDVRVLNCLHLYCHRCILQLRTEAQKGDAIRGFQSFCVKPGCEQVVSGKTTVIDGEIIEFLEWYDKQSPAVTSLPAQINVLSSAAAKYPEDDDIKRKLEQTEMQYEALQANAGTDMTCDLMQIAKLARKPY
ncbi:uncharacterized protein Z520_03220 [Fonsecaea multimorphosa CBS 102226]|uniref:RING-type domain-containing protein n=1 Tax=Fonsecaea multimorphosa CBS 102226 TaxID=1442371 RepID=A0A0D2IU67_9EURO|nr:uncharacterized protein Z520_03220 [Fonsecaea multimorphosa CBS 102226]KIY00557.1 hypothetical protein Z520_03220 [Fonsecaea multimorphosa CBS 102226]